MIKKIVLTVGISVLAFANTSVEKKQEVSAVEITAVETVVDTDKKLRKVLRTYEKIMLKMQKKNQALTKKTEVLEKQIVLNGNAIAELKKKQLEIDTKKSNIKTNDSKKYDKEFEKFLKGN